METQAIYDGPDCTAEAVFYHGKFLYTVTYFYNEDGTVKNMIRVYANGKIEEQ